MGMVLVLGGLVVLWAWNQPERAPKRRKPEGGRGDGGSSLAPAQPNTQLSFKGGMTLDAVAKAPTAFGIKQTAQIAGTALKVAGTVVGAVAAIAGIASISAGALVLAFAAIVVAIVSVVVTSINMANAESAGREVGRQYPIRLAQECLAVAKKAFGEEIGIEALSVATYAFAASYDGIMWSKMSGMPHGIGLNHIQHLNYMFDHGVLCQGDDDIREGVCAATGCSSSDLAYWLGKYKAQADMLQSIGIMIFAWYHCGRSYLMWYHNAFIWETNVFASQQLFMAEFDPKYSAEIAELINNEWTQNPIVRTYAPGGSVPVVNFRKFVAGSSPMMPQNVRQDWNGQNGPQVDFSQEFIFTVGPFKANYSKSNPSHLEVTLK